MANFIMLVGLPASGKSTIAKNFMKELNTIWLSSDKLREELLGNEENQSNNGLIFKEMEKRTLKALNNNQNVIYDATNLSSKRRITLLNKIPSNIQTICYIVLTPYEQCLKNNSTRDRKVPEHVINRMYKSFEVPYYNEGWDFIECIYPFGKQGLSKVWNELQTTPHDNPHHTLTIGKHMLAAQEYFNDKYLYPCGLEDKIHMSYLSITIQSHDAGKLFCKTFTNTKGEMTPVAHYYHHENVGAYLFLLSGIINSEIDLLYCALLIQHHMDYFKGEKYLKKIEKLYGKDFIEDLELIHEADLAAH